jgi:hypothetical protein
MIIEIEIPDTLVEGRRSSFKKGIADSLIESATTHSLFDYTPDGHELAREQGRKVGKSLIEKIQKTYLK